MIRTAPPSRFSVRQRITGAVALLTALALVAVGVTVYIVEAGRIDRSIDTALAQEISEFRALERTGVDPDTGEPFASVDRLLEVFLQRNLPDDYEMLFAFPVSGNPTKIGNDPDLQPTPALDALTRLVADNRESGGRFTLDTGGTTFRVAIQSVGNGEGFAAFVVTHNVTEARAELGDLMITYALVAALGLLMISTLASFVAGRLLHPVRRLSEAAQGISGGDLSRRITVTGNDDLTELQRTFNEMLDRLEDAFAAQRQLLDDAGHELRTPLTILRGHLELVDPYDPQEVDATRGLLIDEVDRMARLVGDLLVLAKARRPDFITMAESDVEVLTQGIFDKSRALGPRTWTLDGLAAARTVLDGQRVTQAMLQLVDNAVQHTKVGDEIGIGSRVTEGHVELWVRDTGPGVRPEERDKIFERFHRGDGRSDDGFGLGLAIVSAIIEAHGGHVELDDTDVGATFRLTLEEGVRA